jgi:Flp pilus assembly secretin CpaC
VSVISTGAGNSPLNIPVTLAVNSQAMPQVSPSAVNVTATLGTNPNPQPIALTSTDPATALSFTITASTDTATGWLSASPASGTTPNTLNVNFNTSGLSVGTYTGSLAIVFTAPDGTMTQVSLPVTMAITSTQTTTPQTPITTGVQTFTPPPTFTFEDLGLVLKVTPHVHDLDEVTLEVTAEFKVLGSSVLNGVPIIANTKYESKVRVSTGEWAVLAGLVTGTQMRNLSGFPGTLAIPFLHADMRSKDAGQTLIVLKPHLLNLPPSESVSKPAWVGTDTHVRSIL